MILRFFHIRISKATTRKENKQNKIDNTFHQNKIIYIILNINRKKSAYKKLIFSYYIDYSKQQKCLVGTF